MKKIFTVSMVCVALAASACANTDRNADYTYETQAPYASERTVGDETVTAAPQSSGQRMFESRQRK